MSVTVTTVTTREQLEECWSVRLDVFVGEQKVPVEEEIDDLDTADTTTHVLARDEETGEALGTGRLLRDPAHPNHLHIGRMAVHAHARGRRVGAAVMHALEEIAVAEARERGAQQITLELSAQEQAMGFYSSLGYEVMTGESYLDCDIPHQDMAKTVRV